MFVWYFAVAIGAGLVAPRIAAAQNADRIQIDDALAIGVTDQPSMTGSYRINADGSVLLPLVGRIQAVGLTAGELEGAIQSRLATYMRQPQVRVSLTRAEWVFVFGEVRTPGRYPYTRGLTLLESLTRAGYPTRTEALVVRSPGAQGPVLPANADPAHVVRVNLLEVETAVASGDMSRNFLLAPNDTVFVPDVDRSLVHVSGEVRNPGAYPIAAGATVLQVVTLAGGATEAAALGRVRITRVREGHLDVFRGRLRDQLRPGDGVLVPERFVVPSLLVVDPAQEPPRIWFGRLFAVAPAFTLNRLGVDTNVLNDDDSTVSDFIGDLTANLDVLIDLRRVQLTGSGGAGLLYFRDLRRESSVNPSYGFGANITVARWLTLNGTRGIGNRHNRFGIEDILAKRREESATVGAIVRPTARSTIELAASELITEFDEGQIFHEIDLRPMLTETVRSVSASVGHRVFPLTMIGAKGSAATHRFPLFPARNADATEFTVGATFLPRAIVNGTLSVGYLQYMTLEPGAVDFTGPTLSLELSRLWRERTRVGGRLQRAQGGVIQPQFSFSIIDRIGVSIQRVLSRRFDVLTDVTHERYYYAPLDAPGEATGLEHPLLQTEGRRYTAQLGIRAGRARVALDATYVQRIGSHGFQGYRTGLTLAYGVFDVQNR
jgi:polysaccharide export outer membrane protein